ncbi:MAG: YceI family protein [Chloroflexota bacterium]
MASYTVDIAHSAAEFSVKHMMVTTVKGVFNDLSGTMIFDADNPANSSIEAAIQVASINTRMEDRDNHLRSADFFDVENFATMTFKSTSVEMTGDDTAKVTGDLTIRDVTKPVVFEVEYFGTLENSPFGDTRAGFQGTTTINREDFGLTWNQALETGGFMVSKEVKITVDLQAVKQAEEAPS